MKRVISTILFFLAALISTPINANPSSPLGGNEGGLSIPFRAAWIATVANIDWPSPEAVGNTKAQQEEMLFLLDSLRNIGLNTIILQVRPTADALYLSEYEPISHWLTGTQEQWGEQEPWDPLAWVIEQAHARDLDVHVWLNPFRITLKDYPLPEWLADTTNHSTPAIMRGKEGMYFQYNNQWYFDPAMPETREWICTIVQDIVDRYDIQAIHMDDYFYPYPAGGKPLPDTPSYERQPRGFTDIRDWRRDNVNLTIQAISETIHDCKPNVEFGISPFGVWRNASVDSTGSKTQAGITNYDDLYADIRLWIQSGWIDYVLPQLYWEIGKKVADYEVLAHWWANEVRGTSCKLYIGMAPYRLEMIKEPISKEPRSKEPRSKEPRTKNMGQKANPWSEGNEIARQMRLNRTIPEISGECFYSTRPLLKNPRGVCDSIKAMYQSELPDSFSLPWE